MAIPKFLPHYSHSDYLQWEGRWELWRGVPVSMTPSPFGPHQRLIARLTYYFVSQLVEQGCTDCEVYTELDWIISDDTVVRPDLSIVCNHPVNRFIETCPALVVEVLSESTAEKDRTAKYELFESQGVQYYIMIDPLTRANEVYHAVDRRFTLLADSYPSEIFLHDQCRITFDPKSKLLWSNF